MKPERDLKSKKLLSQRTTKRRLPIKESMKEAMMMTITKELKSPNKTLQILMIRRTEEDLIDIETRESQRSQLILTH